MRAFVITDRCLWRAINTVIDSTMVRSQSDAAAVSISHARLLFDALYSTSHHPARIGYCCCYSLLGNGD